MKTVRIPTNANPFVITINGAIYSYPAGTVQSVPENIAEIIEQYNDSIPQEAEEQGEIGDVWTKTEEGAEWDKVKGLPEGGVSGQFLKKTSSGADWSTIKEVPSGGTEGQVLTKTASGEEWAAPQGGGGVEIVNRYTEFSAAKSSGNYDEFVRTVAGDLTAGKMVVLISNAPYVTSTFVVGRDDSSGLGGLLFMYCTLLHVYKCTIEWLEFDEKYDLTETQLH